MELEGGEVVSARAVVVADGGFQANLEMFGEHITPRAEIARFDGHTVHFVDGTQADYDVIVACTGYWIAHPFLAPDLADFSRGPVPLYLRMFPARWPTLSFVGLFQPLGCIWPAAELQAKVLARRRARPLASLRGRRIALIADVKNHEL